MQKLGMKVDRSFAHQGIEVIAYSISREEWHAGSERGL
jgi:hypothetical protein